MDFDEQLGLEDEHLQSFEDEVFMDAPTDLEPVAGQVVLSEQESAEDDVVETMDKSPVRERSPSPDGLHHVDDSVDIQGDELIDNIGRQPVPLVWLQSWQFE